MGEKSNCLQFIFSIPKSWSTFRDFWSIESAEDQPSLSKHETYLSVIMTPEFKEMQDDLWEILPTDATAGSQLYNLQVNPKDLHLWSRSSSANIKMNLRHWKVLYLLRSFDFPSAGSDKRRSGGGIYSGQNLTPSKMATRVLHLSILWETSEFPFKVHAIPDLLKVFSAKRFLSVLNTSTPNQETPATNQFWSPLTVTQPYLPPPHNV